MVLTIYNEGLRVRVMFERFTNPARRVVVLSQEEARRLKHNYIGTEHILLALLHRDSGIPVRVLEAYGISLVATRQEVIDIVGLGKRPPEGHIPFTPRAKKVLELSLREALALKSDDIGPEHLLLALIQEGSGVAAQVMKAHADDLLPVRLAVLDQLASRPPVPAGTGRWLRRRSARLARSLGRGEAGEPGSPSETGESGEHEELRTTPAAEASLDEATRLAGSGPVGSHHLLLAALADPNAAAARTLAGLGVDLDQARAALRTADVSGTSDESPQDAGRRQMTVQVLDSGVVVRATDEEIVGLARAAVDLVGEPETGIIRGDQLVSVGLGAVWEALRDSLTDISYRAGASARPVKGAAGSGPAGSGSAGSGPAGSGPAGSDGAEPGESGSTTVSD
jgi:ATP-dependent Clp protease ATP-binding subunit ClpA